jgi:hypothetical protein
LADCLQETIPSLVSASYEWDASPEQGRKSLGSEFEIDSKFQESRREIPPNQYLSPFWASVRLNTSDNFSSPIIVHFSCLEKIRTFHATVNSFMLHGFMTKSHGVRMALSHTAQSCIWSFKTRAAALTVVLRSICVGLNFSKSTRVDSM